jgi:hypothetical protein
LEAWDQSLRETRRSRSSSPLGVNGRADLPTHPAYGLKPGRPTPGQSTLLRLPFAQTSSWRCRNINLLSITYAFRPRLRNRLTLSRLPLPRKPKTYGEWVSHPFYRYLCLHKLFQDLQQFLRSAFTGDWNAPLPPHQNRSFNEIRSFGIVLEPR